MTIFSIKPEELLKFNVAEKLSAMSSVKMRVQGHGGGSGGGAEAL